MLDLRTNYNLRNTISIKGIYLRIINAIQPINGNWLKLNSILVWWKQMKEKKRWVQHLIHKLHWLHISRYIWLSEHLYGEYSQA